MGERERLRQELETHLPVLTARYGPETAGRVGDIIRVSIESGRAQRFLSSGTVPDLGTYVERVAQYYQAHRDYMAALRAGDAESWQPLLGQLAGWAKRLLWHAAFNADRRQHALDCAHDAALVLANNRFPYDTAFAPYAYVVLRNVTQHYINRYLHDRQDVHYYFGQDERTDDWLQNLPDPATVGQPEHENRSLLYARLHRAIGSLTPLQLEFVFLYYFDDKSYDEIAQIMGREVNTLYKLRHDVVEKLRQNWEL
jgi:RNA polymerase sigma factor (sigma-70 family)